MNGRHDARRCCVVACCWSRGGRAVRRCLPSTGMPTKRRCRRAAAPGVARINGAVGTPGAASPPQLSYATPDDDNTCRGRVPRRQRRLAATSRSTSLIPISARWSSRSWAASCTSTTSSTRRCMARRRCTRRRRWRGRSCCRRWRRCWHRTPPPWSRATACIGWCRPRRPPVRPTLASGPTAGSEVLPLHYASAEDLAKVLQPFAGPGARIHARSRPERAADQRRTGRARQSGEPGARRSTSTCSPARHTPLLPVPEGGGQGFCERHCRTPSAARGVPGWPACCGWCRWTGSMPSWWCPAQPRYIDEATPRLCPGGAIAPPDGAQLARLLPAEQPRRGRRLYTATGVHAERRDRAAGSPTGAGASSAGSAAAATAGGPCRGVAPVAALSSGRQRWPAVPALAPVSAGEPAAASAAAVSAPATISTPSPAGTPAAGRADHQSDGRPIRCSAASTPVRNRSRRQQPCASSPTTRTTHCWSTRRSRRKTPSRRCCERSTSCRSRCGSMPSSPRSRSTTSCNMGTQFFFKSGGVNGILNQHRVRRGGRRTRRRRCCRRRSPDFVLGGQRRGRRAYRPASAAGGDHGACACPRRRLLVLDNQAGAAAGRRPRALPDVELAEHDHQRAPR